MRRGGRSGDDGDVRGASPPPCARRPQGQRHHRAAGLGPSSAHRAPAPTWSGGQARGPRSTGSRWPRRHGRDRAAQGHDGQPTNVSIRAVNPRAFECGGDRDHRGRPPRRGATRYRRDGDRARIRGWSWGRRHATAQGFNRRISPRRAAHRERDMGRLRHVRRDFQRGARATRVVSMKKPARSRPSTPASAPAAVRAGGRERKYYEEQAGPRDAIAGSPASGRSLWYRRGLGARKHVRDVGARTREIGTLARSGFSAARSCSLRMESVFLRAGRCAVG